MQRLDLQGNILAAFGGRYDIALDGHRIRLHEYRFAGVLVQLFVQSLVHELVPDMLHCHVRTGSQHDAESGPENRVKNRDPEPQAIGLEHPG